MRCTAPSESPMSATSAKNAASGAPSGMKYVAKKRGSSIPSPVEHIVFPPNLGMSTNQIGIEMSVVSRRISIRLLNVFSISAAYLRCKIRFDWSMPVDTQTHGNIIVSSAWAIAPKTFLAEVSGLSFSLRPGSAGCSRIVEVVIAPSTRHVTATTAAPAMSVLCAAHW